MDTVNYLLSLVDQNEIKIDDEFKFQIAITIVKNNAALLKAFQDGVEEKRKLQ